MNYLEAPLHEVRQTLDCFQMFPKAEAVFADKRLAQHIIPLLSIDLSAMHPEWHGHIHLVTPIEPHECYIGDLTKPFHSEFCCENWLAFRLNGEDKYELLTDIRYFLLENEHKLESESDSARQALTEHYEAAKRFFEFSEARYLKHKGLYWPKRPWAKLEIDSSAEPMAIVDQLGGAVSFGNWTECPPVPMAFELDGRDSDDVRIRLKSGAPLHFIACVPAYHYLKNGADSVLMFYEPHSRIVLFTFDWT